MTYVSEYFHCFASSDLKERVAARIQKFVQFNMAMDAEEQTYEKKTEDLLSWIYAAIKRLESRDFGSTPDSAQEAFQAHKKYLSSEKIPKITAKLDLEADFANIQTKLSVYERRPYFPPSGLGVDDLDKAWEALEDAEKARGVAVRENMFRFITKSASSITPEQMKEFESAFNHFDKDASGSLDPIELKAALSSLSISFKSEQEFEKLFTKIAEGNSKISKEQYINYMISISEDKDNKESVDAAFMLMSDNRPQITSAQLKVHPLKGEEVDFLKHDMPQADEDQYDYPKYTALCFKD